MRRIRLSSPAKLNLFLKVLNKRPDGFHNISTVFERIDLSDEILLKLNPSGGIRIDCVHPQVPGGPKNLVYQAAKLLRDDFRVKEGVDIYIKKNIPVAAGLGGGSGNAATVLKGLNELWELRLSRPQLLSYARRLGSDVAFFFMIVRGLWGQSVVILSKNSTSRRSYGMSWSFLASKFTPERFTEGWGWRRPRRPLGKC